MTPDLTEDETPVLPRASEQPLKEPERVQALAESLNCVLGGDVCLLADVKRSTLESWAKRRQGPAYVMFGNRRLYPLDALRKYLTEHQREHHADPRGLL